MKRLNQYKIFAVIAFAAFFLSACVKLSDIKPPEIDVVYSTEVDGFTVKFINQTQGGVSYKWDFGDGASSEEESPTHTYAVKGKYVPTLYVTTKSGNVVEGSTVLRISKTSPVKLNDNTFDDWNDITNNAYTFNVAGNAFKAAKFDYDGSFVYFYFEMKRTLADNDIFDFYLDTDNQSTGYATADFPGAGIDVLIEGQILATTDSWADMLIYVGPGWNWEAQSVSGFYTIGTVKEENGLLKFEGKFDRAKIKGLTGTGMKLGVMATKNDWSVTVGSVPPTGTQAIAIDMTE